MRKRFLSCIMVVLMLAALVSVPVFADDTVYEGDFSIDLKDYTSIKGASLSGDVLKITSTTGYAVYEAYVSEDASYYVNSTMTGSGIVFTVNGESVTRRCGRIKNGNDYVMLDEVQLKAGQANTIKVSGATVGSGGTGDVSALFLTKLPAKQYTFSMNTFDNQKRYQNSYFTDSYKNFGTGVGALDPWLAMTGAVSAYPEGDSAPYVVLNVEIPESGSYYPAVAKGSGGSCVMLTINDTEMKINDDCTKQNEVFGITGANGEWLKYNQSIYLAAGTYPLKISLYNPISDKWDTNVGAVRFYKASDESGSGDDTDEEAKKVYEGDIVFDLSEPNDSYGIKEENGSFYMKSGSWMEFEVNVSEYAAYYVNFKSTNAGTANFYIDVRANGKTVNSRTGSTKNSEGATVFQDELHLKEGKNTVTISTRGSNDGYLSDFKLQKLENLQFTTSMHTAGGPGITAKATNLKPEKGNEAPFACDPWFYIYNVVSNYPPPDSPYITFETNIEKEGYYYLELARGSGSNAIIYVDGQCFDMNKDAVDTGEKYISSSYAAASCSWKRNKNVVFLTEGVHDVTIKAVGSYYISSDEGDRWRLPVGAVRFIQSPKQHVKVTVEGEDAKIFMGDSVTAYKYDRDDIVPIVASSDAAAFMSGSNSLSVNIPAEDGPIKLEYDLVIKQAGEYSVDIMKIHNAGEFSKGKLAIISQDGDFILEEVLLDDENVTVTEKDYLKNVSGTEGLDVIRLNDTVYLPSGTYKMIYSFMQDDTGVDGEKISVVLDAFVFTEMFDSTDIAAKLSKNSVCKGQRINVDFVNGEGKPVYLNALGSVSFKSEAPNVATVSSDGTIRGISIGNTIITVNVDGKTFKLPVYVTASNGLIINSVGFNEDGNIDLTYIANEGAAFDIVVANYDKIKGTKTSLRGVFVTNVKSDGTRKTETVVIPSDVSGLGNVYEIYIWETEKNMVPVYGKIQLK